MAVSLKYDVIIYWSVDGESFIAEMPELAGCAADGLTPDAALAEIPLVVQWWIETARELGCVIPEPRARLLFALLQSTRRLLLQAVSCSRGGADGLWAPRR